MIDLQIFIRRPVLAICLNIFILVAGIKAITTLNVRQYPKSDLSIVKVDTVYVGASPELVRGFITTPLERVIASADGIDYLESSSKNGLSTITAHLRLNFDINAALTQVQSKIASIRNDLPPEAESPKVTVETSDNRFASMYLSFFSENLEQNQITDYLTRVVQPQLSALSGVEKAEILGARTFAMRVWLKSDELAARDISPSEVSDALRSNNYLTAAGFTKGEYVTVQLTSNSDLKNVEDFKNLVVKNDGGKIVRLSDIADVVLGAENSDEDVRFSGETATFMGIWVLPNANSLDVISRVRAVIPEIEKRLPAGMKVGIPYDATAYIRNAIKEVITTLSETILIVILVIFLFIGSFRAVLVPVVAIPLSLLGATALMLLFGFTINLLTLLAIVLSVGLVVDDAIVMLENVERHIADGMAPLDAAKKALHELVSPTIAMTITLATVYAPIGIQGGLTGALFREFAFTLANAVIMSGVVALTLSPMMSSRLLKQDTNEGVLKRKVDFLLSAITSKYQLLLRRTLNQTSSIAIAAIFIILILPLLYMFSQKELAPREDQGVVFSIVQGSPNATIEQTTLYTPLINRVFESFPEQARSFQITGPSFGFSGALLKPWSERTRSAAEIEAEAWTKMSDIPGVTVIVTTPPPLPGGSDFPVEFIISSTAEPAVIVEFANQLVAAAFASGVFMYADTDLKFDLPESHITFDHDKINSLNLSMQNIAQDIATMTGGNYINRFEILGRSYKVVPQLKRNQRLAAKQLEELYVGSPTGPIQLSSLATLEQRVSPRQLPRFQQLNAAKIQGAIPPGVTIDTALKTLETKAAEILPSDFVIDYAGESRQLRKEHSGFLNTLLLALVLIFLVLAAQFESFRLPLIILAGSVPLAMAGALFFTFVGFTSLNVYSQVGLVTLVGLIAKNGILIVEFASNLSAEGKDRFDAIIQAATTRLRPVLMTSTATVVGHFPLILAYGAGAGARNSIGIVLVTGMIIGTIFTLFVVPALYILIARR